MITMDAAKAKALRAPFPPELIGKLPKPTKADNPKGRCDECGGWHGLPAMHLEYVGHAACTDRLLAVDPSYTWEPMAVDEHGLPLLDRVGNLWIRLTVCGVTRIGVGDGKNAKECISDAIRNAAMRFGVALDLWSKEDLHASDAPEPAAKKEPAAKPEPKPKPKPQEVKDVPKETLTWEEALGRLRAADSTIIWEGLLAHVVGASYTLPMSSEDKVDVRRRIVFLVDAVEAEAALGDFPPPDLDAYQKAVASAFDGLAVEVEQFVSKATATEEEEAS